MEVSIFELSTDGALNRFVSQPEMLQKIHPKEFHRKFLEQNVRWVLLPEERWRTNRTSDFLLTARVIPLTVRCSGPMDEVFRATAKPLL